MAAANSPGDRIAPKGQDAPGSNATPGSRKDDSSAIATDARRSTRGPGLRRCGHGERRDHRQRKSTPSTDLSTGGRIIEHPADLLLVRGSPGSRRSSSLGTDPFGHVRWAPVSGGTLPESAMSLAKGDLIGIKVTTWREVTLLRRFRDGEPVRHSIGGIAMHRALQFASLLGIAAFASGCATLTKGTSQTLTVTTDPTGAVCTLSRDAKPLAVINPTPGSMPVEKGRGTISVVCKRMGYQDSSGVLASEFQAMTLGNILIGGLIGVAVDAASGAMHEYPPMVTITMIPEAFANTAERDTFFDRMKATLVKESAEVKERIAVRCGASDCRVNLEEADAQTRAKLAEIDQKRAQATVRAP